MILKLSPAAIVAACALMLASSAPGLTLYDGSYSTDMSSSTPNGLAPASGVTLPYPKSNIRLYWNQVPGAELYQLQLARQDSASADCNVADAFQIDNVVLTTTTGENEWVPTLTSTEQGSDIWTGTYCWRVRTTGKGYGEWSTAHRFTRTWASSITGLRFYNDHDGPIPRTPASADYATGSTLTRNAGYLTWTALDGASEYEVQVSPSQSFSEGSLVAYREGLTDNKVVLLHLPDDTYYWRVRGVSPNGTEGAWSTGSNTFTVKWHDPSWSDPAKLWPADSSVQSEMRLGWTPMPGASHYEYQVGTNGGCFWDPTNPKTAPELYGSWTLAPAVKDSNGNFWRTQNPSWSQCRLTPLNATTINNWVTLTDIFAPEVYTYISNDCYDEETPEPLCERAHFPDNVPDDQPAAIWLGPGMTAGEEDGEAYSISWRVRPVYVLDQESESGWKVNGDEEIVVYGSWTKYRQGGANREQRFEINPASAPFTSIADRCDNPGINPTTNDCLEHIGSTMRADEAVGVGNSSSMQVPLVTWKPFPGAGGYIVQYARDPLFNNMERSVFVPAVKSIGYGFQQSYIPTNGMVDNAEDTGMWWRVIPCMSQVIDVTIPSYTNCAALYSDQSPGLPTSIDASGYTDMAVAQEFKKRARIQMRIVENFEGSTPLISWATEGASSTDYTAWSSGIAGAHHYEVQLARNPFMTQDAFTLNTTIPRIAPFAQSENAGAGETEQLPDGIWYFRVRPVDRDGIVGTWTPVSSFNKRIPAPTPVGANGEAGAGVVVAWTDINGAGSYEVQWSTDSGFEKDVNKGTTLQSTFRIPSTELGTFYWRVRANVGGVLGQWSGDVRYVNVIPATTLRYGLNRNLTLAGDRVQITGELRVAGEQANGQRVRLQRKRGGCDAKNGTYVDSSTAVTGEDADDGMVNIPARLVQNTCFRLAWVNDAAVKYSAPIEAKVAPYVKVRLNRKRMRRGQQFCVTMRSNTAVNGRMRVQYRSGRTWRTTRTAVLRNHRGRRVCARITKAGRYPTRIVLDKLTKRGQGWKQFENVIRGGGIVRVNDVWRVVRTR